MLNLPSIEVDISRKQLSIKAIQDGSIWPDRSEELEILARRYFAKHTELTRDQMFSYLFWLIRDKDYLIFTFGKDSWDYIQFTKEGENLILDFPYNNIFGHRHLQIDRVEIVLKNHGFSRFVSPLTLNPLQYEDYCFGKIVTLEASFGKKRNGLASSVMQEIVTDVFHLAPDCKWEYVLGSQRGAED